MFEPHVPLEREADEDVVLRQQRRQEVRFFFLSITYIKAAQYMPHDLSF